MVDIKLKLPKYNEAVTHQTFSFNNFNLRIPDEVEPPHPEAAAAHLGRTQTKKQRRWIDAGTKKAFST
jgi:hypothetical protein